MMRTVWRGLAGTAPAVLHSNVGVLHEAQTVWAAMLDGWVNQQFVRHPCAGTVEPRRATVVRFRQFVSCYPWILTSQAVRIRRF